MIFFSNNHTPQNDIYSFMGIIRFYNYLYKNNCLFCAIKYINKKLIFNGSDTFYIIKVYYKILYIQWILRLI